MTKKNKIYIIDVTNRDGVQTAFIGLSKLQKTMLNVYLSEMGVYQSEIGFQLCSMNGIISMPIWNWPKGAMGEMRLRAGCGPALKMLSGQ